VAPRAELLKAEIDKTKQDLAGHLAELKVHSRAAQRRTLTRAAAVLGVIAAGVVLFKLVRALRRRGED
jgi:hypothetical protein